MKRVLPLATVDPSTKNRPTYYKVMEVVGMTIFAIYMVLLASLLIRSAGVFDFTLMGLALILILPIAGYILADFFSGFVHFLGDTFGTEDIPFFGPHFIRPFRAHHIDEKEITRHGFIEVNGTNCIISLVVIVPAFYWLPIMSSFTYFLIGEVIWFMILSIFLTNQIHKWAHQDKPPAFIRFLQRYRLILSPEHHQVHHTAPFATYYCITSGWLNALLAKLHFFDGIERIFKSKNSQNKIV